MQLATLFKIFFSNGICIAALLMQCTAAQAAGPASASIRSGTLVFSVAEGEPVAIPLVRTVVQVEITGSVARVEVRQQFRNPSDQWAEGIYAFPLPPNADLDQISVVQAGKLLSNVRRTVHQEPAVDAKFQQLSDPRSTDSLLRIPLGDIAPHADVEVILGYVQIVASAFDKQRLRIPLAANRTPIPDLSLENELSTSLPACAWMPIAQPAPSSGATQAVSVRVSFAAGAQVTAITSQHAIEVSSYERITVTTSEADAATDADFELEWTTESPPAQPVSLARAGITQLLPRLGH